MPREDLLDVEHVGDPETIEPKVICPEDHVPGSGGDAVDHKVPSFPVFQAMITTGACSMMPQDQVAELDSWNPCFSMNPLRAPRKTSMSPFLAAGVDCEPPLLPVIRRGDLGGCFDDLLGDGGVFVLPDASSPLDGLDQLQCNRHGRGIVQVKIFGDKNTTDRSS